MDVLGVPHIKKSLLVDSHPFFYYFKSFIGQVAFKHFKRSYIYNADIFAVNDVYMRRIMFRTEKIHFDDHTVKS